MRYLCHLSLTEAVQGLQKKEFSSRELTLAHLERIQSWEERINAFITTTPESALLAADASDKRRARGDTLSPLDGIVYALKDNISSDGIRTTCGSRMLENYIPPYSATVANRLCECGSVLVGKTNLDEFAMGISGETSFFGVTSNPNNPRYVAGGSSSGSAAAVACGETLFALGSDTGGSVRQPASFCGIVGLRPTYGALSRYGLISFAPSLDQIGIMTRTVDDCALVFSELAARDSKDSASCDFPSLHINKNVNINKLKVALLYELGAPLSDEVMTSLARATAALGDLGATVSAVSLPHAKDAYATYYTIACAEASSNLARFDGIRYGHRAASQESLSSLYRSSRSEGFGEEVKRRLLFGTLVLSQEYSSDFYLSALSMREKIADELSSLLDEYDLILMPTVPCTAYLRGQAPSGGFMSGTDDIFCTLAPLAYLPALTLPVPTRGLPTGVQLMSHRFSEPLLFSVGSALSKALGGGK